MEVCLFTGCERGPRGLGYCPGHYRQHRLGQQLRPLAAREKNKGRTCEGPGCDQPADQKGLCSSHASQRKRGRELTPLGKVRPGPKKYADGVPCAGPSCDRLATTNNLCCTHNQQVRRGRALTPIGLRAPRRVAQCREDGCQNTSEKRGLCGTHYTQYWRTGRTRPIRPIRARKGNRTEPTPDGLCRVNGCGNSVHVRKWQLCVGHYGRFVRHGDPLAWRRKTPAICRVDGCGLRVVAHELCDTHYRRQKRYGTTDAPERPTVCTIEGCGDLVAAKALCDRHYRRDAGGTLAPRNCHWCGNEINVNANANRRFCDQKCREREMYVRRRETGRADWLRQYGLTLEQFDTMLAAQGGGCGICGTTNVPARGSFCVDHCHETGRIRGLLCSECNKGLGQFKDDPTVLRAAIAYLEMASIRDER